MSFLRSFSQKIEEQEWDHVPFLRNILILLLSVILIFYIWIFMLEFNGIVSTSFLENALIDLLQGNLFGILTGIIVSALSLAKFYLDQEWDLHKVVPYGLFIHLLLSVILLVANYSLSIWSSIFEIALLMGYLLGGLIPILAYAGEVEREHQGDDDDDDSL